MQVPGLKTWLPQDVKKQIFLRDRLVQLYKSWSYEPIIIPTLVDNDTLNKANVKFKTKTFKVLDSDGSILALRTELTQPIAKEISSRIDELELPLRLYYASTVYRYSGKRLTDQSREIQQAGVELVGRSGFAADFEALALFVDSFKQFGLRDYKVSITDARLWLYAFETFGDLARDAYALLLKGDLVAYRDLIPTGHFLRAFVDATDLAEFKVLVACDDIAEILEAIEMLEKLDLGIHFEPSQCPDINLYTGLHFMLFVHGLGDFVAMGGRYDRLYASFGADQPAIGFAFYLSSLLNVLQAQALIPDDEAQAEELKLGSDLFQTLAELRSKVAKGKVVKLCD